MAWCRDPWNGEAGPVVIYCSVFMYDSFCLSNEKIMKRKIEGRTKMQRQNRRHERWCLIWIIKYGIRAKFVSDNNNWAKCIALFKFIQKQPLIGFYFWLLETQMWRRQRRSMHVCLYVFLLGGEGKKNNSFVLLETVFGHFFSMWRPLGQLWGA